MTLDVSQAIYCIPFSSQYKTTRDSMPENIAFTLDAKGDLDFKNGNENVQYLYQNLYQNFKKQYLHQKTDVVKRNIRSSATFVFQENTS